MVYFQNLAPGRLPDPWSDLADLGDVFLGMAYIQRKCKQENKAIEEVIPVSIQLASVYRILPEHQSHEPNNSLY